MADTQKETETVTAEAVKTETQPAKPELDGQGRAYATGRRKDAVARVWIKQGSGKYSINGKDLSVYFGRPTQQMVINQAFEVTNTSNQFDVFCTVSGGGLSGQAGAIKHGISRALIKFTPDLRPTLKQAGFLTRDDRQVERKKPGRRKARRGMQWAKR